MFKVTKAGPNRLDIALSGKLNADDMKTALNALESTSSDIENGIMLYEIIDFHLPTLHAIAVEFSRLIPMFGFIKKFRKAALLSDKSWIQKAGELEGLMIPGLEIKAFSRDHREEAERWLSK